MRASSVCNKLALVQGRVTDHRVGLTEHGMEGVLGGTRLHVFVDALQAQHKQEQLEELEL